MSVCIFDAIDHIRGGNEMSSLPGGASTNNTINNTHNNNSTHNNNNTHNNNTTSIAQLACHPDVGQLLSLAKRHADSPTSAVVFPLPFPSLYNFVGEGDFHSSTAASSAAGSSTLVLVEVDAVTMEDEATGRAITIRRHEYRHQQEGGDVSGEGPAASSSLEIADSDATSPHHASSSQRCVVAVVESYEEKGYAPLCRVIADVGIASSSCSPSAAGGAGNNSASSADECAAMENGKRGAAGIFSPSRPLLASSQQFLQSVGVEMTRAKGHHDISSVYSGGVGANSSNDVSHLSTDSASGNLDAANSFATNPLGCDGTHHTNTTMIVVGSDDNSDDAAAGGPLKSHNHSVISISSSAVTSSSASAKLTAAAARRFTQGLAKALLTTHTPMIAGGGGFAGGAAAAIANHTTNNNNTNSSFANPNTSSSCAQQQQILSRKPSNVAEVTYGATARALHFANSGAASNANAAAATATAAMDENTTSATNASAVGCNAAALIAAAAAAHDEAAIRSMHNVTAAMNNNCSSNNGNAAGNSVVDHAALQQQEMMKNELLRMQQYQSSGGGAYYNSAVTSGDTSMLQQQHQSNAIVDHSVPLSSLDISAVVPAAAEEEAVPLPPPCAPQRATLDSYLVASLAPCINAEILTPAHTLASATGTTATGVEMAAAEAPSSSIPFAAQPVEFTSSEYIVRSIEGLAFSSSNPSAARRSGDPNRFFIGQPSAKALAATKHVATHFHPQPASAHDPSSYTTTSGGGVKRPADDRAIPFNESQQLAPSQITYSYDGTSPFWSQKAYWFQTVMGDFIQRTFTYSQDLSAGWQRWKVGPLAGMDRSVIVNSVDEVCSFLRVSRSGFYAAVSLLDYFLSVCDAPRVDANGELPSSNGSGPVQPNEDLLDANNFRCLIIAAVYIASKLHDVQPPHMRRVIEALGVPVASDVLCNMELRLISTMQFCTHPLTLKDVTCYLAHFPLRPTREHTQQRWRDVANKKRALQQQQLLQQQQKNQQMQLQQQQQQQASAGSSSGLSSLNPTPLPSGGPAGVDAPPPLSPATPMTPMTAAATNAIVPYIPDFTAPLPLPIIDSLRMSLKTLTSLVSDIVIRNPLTAKVPTLLLGAAVFRVVLAVSDCAEVVNFEEDDDGYDVFDVHAPMMTNAHSGDSAANAAATLARDDVLVEDKITVVLVQLSHFRPKRLGFGGFLGFVVRALRDVLGTASMPMPSPEVLAEYYHSRKAARRDAAVNRARYVMGLKHALEQLCQQQYDAKRAVIAAQREQVEAMLRGRNHVDPNFALEEEDDAVATMMTPPRRNINTKDDDDDDNINTNVVKGNRSAAPSPVATAAMTPLTTEKAVAGAMPYNVEGEHTNMCPPPSIPLSVADGTSASVVGPLNDSDSIRSPAKGGANANSTNTHRSGGNGGNTSNVTCTPPISFYSHHADHSNKKKSSASTDADAFAAADARLHKECWAAYHSIDFDALLSFEEEPFDEGAVAVQYYLAQCEAEVLHCCASVLIGEAAVAAHRQQEYEMRYGGGGANGVPPPPPPPASTSSSASAVPPILMSRYSESIIRSAQGAFNAYYVGRSRSGRR